MLSQRLVRGQNVQIKKIAKPAAVTAKTSAIEMTSVAVGTAIAAAVIVIVIATEVVDVDLRTKPSLR
jgi:hypothetical protein